MTAFSFQRSPFLWAVGVFLGLVAVFPQRAAADPVEVQYQGLGNGGIVTFQYLGNTITGPAGQLRYQVIQSSDPSQVGVHFLSFCIDNQHHTNPGQTVLLDPKSLTFLKDGAQVGYLYNTYGAGALSDQDAIALQLAIWKEVDDGTNNLTTGTFRFFGDPTLAARAVRFINEADAAVGGGYVPRSPLFGDAHLDPQKGQNIVFPPSPQPVIPEPGTLLLAGLGLVGLMGWRFLGRRHRGLTSA
jgi:hypothetical protein